MNWAVGAGIGSAATSASTYQIGLDPLRAVAFASTDTATSPAARTVSFTVTDADSETSNTMTRTIDVTAQST